MRGSIVFLGSIATVGMVAIAIGQTRQVSVEARVLSEDCGQSQAAQSTTCVVTLGYTVPDGTPGSVTFHGVDASRLHERDGAEWLTIYFSSRSSATPINPQEEIPVWATVLIIVCIWFVGGILIRRVLRSPRRQPPATSL